MMPVSVATRNRCGVDAIPSFAMTAPFESNSAQLFPAVARLRSSRFSPRSAGTPRRSRWRASSSETAARHILPWHGPMAAVEYRKALPDAAYTKTIKTYYLNFGTALIAAGYYEEAAQMLEQYTRLSPRDHEGHYQLGVAYEIMSERSLDEVTTRRAVEVLKHSIELEPRHAIDSK